MNHLGSLLTRQLHFVTGKGGVGKSVVSCALAVRFAEDGQRTLLCQINAPDSHARLLGVPRVTDEPIDVQRNLTAVNVIPATALREYALMILKFEALYRTVFENRLTKTFLRFVPSMAELTMLGKIWFHSTEQDGDRPRYDRIVVDCPSTGHGLKFLRVAQIVRDASRIGPMAEKTSLMADVVADPRRSALHVVALPEDMPVNESLELLDQVRKTRVVPPGAVILNHVTARLFDADTLAALGQARAAVDPDAALRVLLEVGARRAARERLEADEEARLRAATPGMPLVRLPELLVDAFGRPEVERFAALFKEAAA